jgi:ATPase subunit of ABC transporter with duplicated ATPase domains
MFHVNELQMVYGNRTLFKDATFHLKKKVRYGLVGANGAGKTTLLKILSGELEPNSGKIRCPKEVKVGVLRQDYKKYQDEPILSVVLKGDQAVWKAFEKKQLLLSKIHLAEEDIEELSKIEEELRLRHGYQSKSRAARMLEGLGILLPDHLKALRTLSGGFQIRVMLAQVLFSVPDLLLLDEPTNYLDIFSIRWLEGYLKGFSGTLVLSSHDRDFLNQVSERILDIDYGKIKEYPGNFDYFVKKKENEVLYKESELESTLKRKEDLNRFIDRFRAKSSKARQAQSRVRIVKKLEEEEKKQEILPSSRQYPHLHFPAGRPSGGLVLTVKDLSKRYGKRLVLNNLSFEVERGEKVAFVGANGIGKSTFLEIITGQLKSDQGSFRWGPHTTVGYFPQNFERLLDPELSLYDWLESKSQCFQGEKLRQVLGATLFKDREVQKKVGALSGGEGARLIFAYLMLRDHNILVFDEPTNHLDMEAVEALIEALHSYKGTVVLVSHNRYFISQVTSRVIEFQEGGILDFQGGYEEFVEAHGRDYLSETSFRQPQKKERRDTVETRREEKRKREKIEREIRKCEEAIENLERQIENIHLILSTPNYYEKTSPDEVQVLLNKKDKLEKEKEERVLLWENFYKQLS